MAKPTVKPSKPAPTPKPEKAEKPGKGTSVDSNLAPIAGDDGPFGPFESSGTGAIAFGFSTLLANDTDANGDALAITGLSGGSVGGTPTVPTGSNNIHFTPTPGFVGDANFHYQVSDGRGGTDTALVNFTIAAPPPPPPPKVNMNPVAVADELHTTIGTILVTNDFDLLANDTDAEGDPLRIEGLVGTPVGGKASFYLDDAGNRIGNVILFEPDPGFVGEASFKYEIFDGHGTAIGTVKVDVSGVAPPPPPPPPPVSDPVDRKYFFLKLDLSGAQIYKPLDAELDLSSYLYQTFNDQGYTVSSTGPVLRGTVPQDQLHPGFTNPWFLEWEPIFGSNDGPQVGDRLYGYASTITGSAMANAAGDGLEVSGTEIIQLAGGRTETIQDFVWVYVP